MTDTAGNGNAQTDSSTVTVDRTDPDRHDRPAGRAPTAASRPADDVTNDAQPGLRRRPSARTSSASPPADFSYAGTRHRLRGRLPVTVGADRLRRDRHRLRGGHRHPATFAADGATDTAGNGPTPQTDGPRCSSTAPTPTATIDLQPGSDSGASTTDNLTNAVNLTFDVDFDEDVFGLAASDFSVGGSATGCSVGAPIGSGDSYDVTLSGCSEGTVILTLAAAGVTDTAGNANAATSGPTVTVDRTGPTVTIDLQAASDSGISTTDDVTNAATLVFDVTFNEDVSGVTAADFSFAGSATGCSVDSGHRAHRQPYELTVSGCGEGTVTCDLRRRRRDRHGRQHRPTPPPTARGAHRPHQPRPPRSTCSPARIAVPRPPTTSPTPPT